MKKEEFDIFVIGSGVAGKTVAEECASQGLKVAIAEKRELGGTCSNRGCDPKKVLLGVSEILQRATDLKGKGIVKNPKISWKALQKFKRTFTAHIPKATKKDFKEKGIPVFSGVPKFTGPNQLQINNTAIEADKIVIATGLVPREIDIKGQKHFKLSDDFLDLKKLPKKIVFVGAGYIGMEFAQLAARAGSKVTVIDNGERILKGFDSDLSDMLRKDSERLGIKFIFSAEVLSLKKGNRKYKLKVKVDDSKKTIKANLVFNTAGRVPSIAGLDLESGNVDYNENGIVVNDYMQSKTNSSVFACGDVTDHSLPLSPLSGYEANIVNKNITKTTMTEIDVPLVPAVVFTIPNFASVGFSEEEAKSRYKNIIVKQGQVPGWYNNKRIGGSEYAFKVLINERTDEIVGVHLLSPEASEIINLFTMAMNRKLRTIDIKRMIFTYPSWSNDIKIMLADR